MTLDELDRLPRDEAREAFARCCGVRAWIDGMVAARPYGTPEELFEWADRIWGGLTPDQWRQAFDHHPRIGDLSELRRRFASTAEWAASEQSGAASAEEETLAALARGNHEYEERFGYRFIVCATGRSAAEMLALLEARLHGDPRSEIQVAAEEQRKITRLRLEKLIGLRA